VGDFATAQRLSHKLKGAAGMLGAQALADLAAGLEARLRASAPVGLKLAEV
jgi:HPt (histidine-containing phosphotransfer) domain-containing protein